MKEDNLIEPENVLDYPNTEFVQKRVYAGKAYKGEGLGKGYAVYWPKPKVSDAIANAVIEPYGVKINDILSVVIGQYHTRPAYDTVFSDKKFYDNNTLTANG